MGCLCMSRCFGVHVKRSHRCSSVHDELHCTVLYDYQGALITRHALRTLRPAGVHGKSQERLGSGPCRPMSLACAWVRSCLKPASSHGTVHDGSSDTVAARYANFMVPALQRVMLACRTGRALAG